MRTSYIPLFVRDLRPGAFVSIAILSLTCVVFAQSSTTTSPTTTPSQRTPEELADLNNWVSIVKSPNVEPDRREYNAMKLITSGWPEATQAAMEILSGNSPAERIAICQVLAKNPSHVSQFVDPLLSLLADDNEQVRNYAALALAASKEPHVSQRLKAIAIDASMPNTARTSAIESLSRLKDGQLAAGILINLLQNLDGRIDNVLFNALERVSGLKLGRNIAAWQEWWSAQSQLSREEWLQHRNELLHRQNRAKDETINQLTQRLLKLSTEKYFSANDEGREELLRSFLTDDVEALRLLAIDQIMTRIGENKPPGETTSAALRSRIQDPSPAVQRGVLQVLSNLRNPQDATLVMELLDKPIEPSVRIAAIDTLGELSNPIANELLMQALQDESPALCAAAAKSLGRLNKGQEQTEHTQECIEALIAAYELRKEQAEVRIALIQAMSNIKDVRFAPMLLENLQADQAEIQLRSITGLWKLGLSEHISAILPLFGNDNASIRREVAVAIGKLGSSESHLQALLNRLSPAVESEASVRDESWQSLQLIWQNKPMDVRLEWCRKLAPYPERQITLLTRLEEQLLGGNGVAPHVDSLLTEVRLMLANRWQEQSKFQESAKYWGHLERMHRTTDPERALEYALRQFEMLLEGNQLDQAIEAAKSSIDELGSQADSTTAQFGECLVSHLEDLKSKDLRGEMDELLTKLQEAWPELTSGELGNRLQAFQPQAEDSETLINENAIDDNDL